MAAITGLDDYGFQPNVALPSSPDGSPVTPMPVTSSPSGMFFEGQCFRGVQTHTFKSSSTTAIYTGNRFGSDITSGVGHLPPCGYQPSELQTAYGLDDVYAAGFDGSGETIVITDAYGSSTSAGDGLLFRRSWCGGRWRNCAVTWAAR